MPKHIAWREGLFIRPQHFQQECHSINEEFMLRFKISGPNMWGLTEFEIDRHLLNTGKFSILRIAGVLPDGTLFEADDLVDRLTIDVKQEDSGKALYLALPINYRNEENTYFEDSEPLTTRYRAKTEKGIPNINVGENSRADITFIYPNFILMKEGDKMDGFSVIKIAIISDVTPNGTVTLDNNFHPTYLHLDRAEAISSKLTELSGILRYRAEKLAEKLSSGYLQTAELGDYLLLQLINRTFSRLYFYSTQEKIHPSELYLELTSLIGELSVFLKKEKIVIKNFLYIHERQWECFEEIFSELKELLSMALESKSIRIPLEKHKYGVYIATLKDKSIITGSSLILTVSSNIQENRLKKLLLDNLKIGTVEEIRNLVNHHLPGFKITPLPAAPREIPYRVNQSYFNIIVTDEQRDKLMRAVGLALHYPEMKNMTLEFSLWAIKNK